jgi:hypothetical protein
MTNVATLYDTNNQKSLFGEAKILTVDNEKRTAKIYLEDLSGIQEIEAAMAIAYDCDLIQGDKVLIAGENIHAIYIIGVLTPKSHSKTYSQSGSYTFLAESVDRSTFQIFSKRNELVIEYDAMKEKTKIHCPAGDLEFLAPAGNMVFQSAKSIELSGETISLKSKKRFDTLVQEHPGSSVSSLSIGNHQAKVSCPDLRVTAKRGNFFIDDLVITGKKVLGNLVHATIKANKLETRTQSIINKTNSLYQFVENLTQLKTGRLKTLIEKTYHLKSKSTVLKSEEDFKIKANKINLG